MKRAKILAATVGLIGVFVAAGLVSCTAQRGDDESQGVGDESLLTMQGDDDRSPEDTEESQIDLPDVAAPGMFDPPTPAEMRDLATIAEQRGISLEEAVATIGWRRGFSQLVQEIAERHQGAFAGAAIEQDGSSWIAFTGAVPTDVVSLVGQFEREVLAPLVSSARIDLVPNQNSP